MKCSKNIVDKKILGWHVYISKTKTRWYYRISEGEKVTQRSDSFFAITRVYSYIGRLYFYQIILFKYIIMLAKVKRRNG